eukprot:gnl/Chilomastix_cuspidata/871.p1 GENE.gnl/Chilomastix_cuspidata/871~~gnl/Chilomastix_cuspidata/871.p1  ORF type:complete len:421 (-),score=224.54 gnl/Chilomastix_cuspidata/871:568-1830(-)
MAKETKLYDILGVDPSCSAAELRRSFLKLSMKWHPDKNKGNAEAEAKFKEISAAYDILKDAEKRDIYDKYGEEGLRAGGAPGGGGGGIFEFFDMMTGGGGRSRARSGPKKGKDLAVAVDITLEEAYEGTRREVQIERKERCDKCAGTGSTKEGATQKCKTCGGRGVVIQMQRMGMMIQQTQTYCPDCHGKGEIIDPKHVCKACKGKKFVAATHTFPVELPGGVPHGEKIEHYGEGHWAPGCTESGDLVFVVRVKEHARFKREGADLVIARSISLAEALCGFATKIVHLDKRVVNVVSRPGEVVKPDAVLCVEGEGMPVYRRSWQRGRLFIKFDVQFPKPAALTPEVRARIIAALPSTRPTKRRIEEAGAIAAKFGTELPADTHYLKFVDPSAPTEFDAPDDRRAYDQDAGEPGTVQCGAQ